MRLATPAVPHDPREQEPEKAREQVSTLLPCKVPTHALRTGKGSASQPVPVPGWLMGLLFFSCAPRGTVGSFPLSITFSPAVGAFAPCVPAQVEGGEILHVPQPFGLQSLGQLPPFSPSLHASNNSPPPPFNTLDPSNLTRINGHRTHSSVATSCWPKGIVLPVPGPREQTGGSGVKGAFM